MAVSSGKSGDSVIYKHTLSSPELALDLMSPLWNLKDGEASEVRGRDVTLPGHFRPDRGRKPIGCSIPLADRSLTFAQELDLKVNLTEQRSFINSPADLSIILYGGDGTYDNDGTLNCTGAFTGYGPVGTGWIRKGDRILIHEPSRLRGAYEVLSYTDANNIVIEKNLGENEDPPTTETFRFLICEGKNIYQTYHTATQLYITKSYELYQKEGPWDSNFLHGLLQTGLDLRIPSTNRRTNSLTALATYAQANDSLVMDKVASLPVDSKIMLSLTVEADRRGILVGNGRKFWLQRGGAYELLLDLGSDDYLGTTWRAAQIARNRLMLVSPDFPPRILHLNRTGDTPRANDEADTLAGCLPPKKPSHIEEIEDLGITQRKVWPSWLASLVTGEGDLSVRGENSTAELKVLVRAVNLQDDLASDFVRALPCTTIAVPTNAPAGGGFGLVPADDDAISVYTVINRDGATYSYPPVIHSRAQYIEVWRTASTGAGVYHLERRMLIADPEQGEDLDEGSDHLKADARALFTPDYLGAVGTDLQYPITLADEDIIALPALTESERTSGGLPPVCQDVVSLLGVTLCFGKANSGATSPTVYARNFIYRNGTYDTSAGTLTGPFADCFGSGSSDVTTDDELVVTFGGQSSSGYSLTEGVYDITATATQTVTIAANLTTEDVNNIHFHIRRPYTWTWPAIASDEDVWYSRTDKFQPEGFPPRVLSLSRTGDTFRRAVTVGDYVVVIMDQGVHLLYLDGISLKKDTIAEAGAGTPWADSVVVWHKTVYWASPDGIRTLTVSNDPDDEGNRGKIGLLLGQKFLRWFREAVENGETIDIGVDVKNLALRVRRRSTETAGSLGSFLSSTERTTDDDGDPLPDPDPDPPDPPPVIPFGTDDPDWLVKPIPTGG